MSGAQQVGAAAHKVEQAAVQKATEAKNLAVQKATEAKNLAVQKATEARNLAVQKASEAKNFAVQKATEAKNLAVRKATQAKDYATKQVAAAKQLAVQKATQAKDLAVRKSVDVALASGRAVADHAPLAKADQVRRSIAKIKDALSKQPAAKTAEPCPLCHLSDRDLNGKFIVPHTDGTCRPSTSPPSPPASGQNARSITYVNGIQTTAGLDGKSGMCATLQKILKSHPEAHVFGVYNATGGIGAAGGIADSLETGVDRDLINQAKKGGKDLAGNGRNPAVDTLSKYLVSQINSGNQPEIWAHSQGGAVSSLALYDAQNQLEVMNTGKDLSGVKVQSFGSAAPSWPEGVQAVHYVNVNDPVPTALGLGRYGGQPLPPGQKVIRFSGMPGHPEFDRPQAGGVSIDYHLMDSAYLPLAK